LLKKALLKKALSGLTILKNSSNKIQYSYLLITPKGIEEKAKLTLDFIRIKTQEYDTLKQEIESLKRKEKNMDKDLEIGLKKTYKWYLSQDEL